MPYRNWIRRLFESRPARRRTLRPPAESVVAVERLESRELLSATASFQSGVLDIQLGANGRSGETVRVGASGGWLVVNTSQGQVIGGRDRIRSSHVTEIRIDGSNRGDKIHLASLFRKHFPNLQRVVVNGHGGHDRIVGSSFNDELFGGGGHDVIHGQGGHDIIRGGQGNDVLYGGAGRDRIYGDAGNDVLRGAAYHSMDRDRDWLIGGFGTDLVTGTSRRDRHTGIERYR